MTNKNEPIPEVAAAHSGLIAVSQSLHEEFGLRTGVPEIIMIEALLVSVRSLAPMELDEYLEVLSDELKDQGDPNTDLLHEHRQRLADTVTLTASARI